MTQSRNTNIDLIKFVLSLIIVTFHCLPDVGRSFSIALYEEWICRICVPFFFLTTGYFLRNADKNRIKCYLKRIIIYYLIALLIYLPFDYLIYLESENKLLLLLFDGVHYHLWFFPAMIIGVLLNELLKKTNAWVQVLLVAILFGFGIFFNEYYRFFMDDYPLLDSIHYYLAKFGETKNGIFFALPLINIGSRIKENGSEKMLFLKLIISAIFSLIEAVFFLKNLSYPFLDLSLFGWLFPYYLLKISLIHKNIINNQELSAKLAKMSTIIYIIHPLVISVVFHFINLSLLLNLLVVLATVIFVAIIFYIIIKNFFKRKINSKI